LLLIEKKGGGVRTFGDQNFFDKIREVIVANQKLFKILFNVLMENLIREGESVV